MRVLVLAPHPDDEVLGVGGTMARLAQEGHSVSVGIVTKGDSTMFAAETIEQVRREAREVSLFLGVEELVFLEGFPAALLDTLPQAQLNRALSGLFARLRPEMLFVPFNGDLHRDHQIVFAAAMVAARPGAEQSVRAIYAYETLSETNWNAPPVTPAFMPNVYLDISGYLETKLRAMSMYQTQLRPAPHERSLEALEALARLRGATVALPAAEAFMLVRSAPSQLSI